MKTLAILMLIGLGILTRPTLAQQAAMTGLKGEYYAGTNFDRLVTTRTDKAINFVWTTTKEGWFGSEERVYVSPAPGVPAENFSVRWTGSLRAPETGVYTLVVSTDDGMRVFLGGVTVLDTWRNQPVTDYSREVELEAGKTYPIKVEYYQVRWDATAKVSWKLPSDPPEAAPRIIGGASFSPPQRPKPLAPKPIEEDKPVAVVVPEPALKPAPKPVRAEVKPKATPADVAVQPADPLPATLRKGTTLTLPNMYFELNSPELLSSSEPTLDQLVAALEKQPEVRIEIAGHTDLAKDQVRSRQLSLERANNIRDYLVENGINTQRISTIGYGCTKPLYNRSDARNRRVEVQVR